MVDYFLVSRILKNIFIDFFNVTEGNNIFVAIVSLSVFLVFISMT